MKNIFITIGKIAGIFALVSFWVFITTTFAGEIISGFPREMQGEAPNGSKALDIGVVLFIQLAVPIAVILVAIKSKTLRITSLIATLIAMLINHSLLEGLHMLDKAWRRGL